MKDRDEAMYWQEAAAERCNEVMCSLKEQNDEYKEATHRRTVLSMCVKGILDEAPGAPLTAEKQDAIREYVELLLNGESMDALIACYTKGFGDALRIVIDTGALPAQR